MDKIVELSRTYNEALRGSVVADQAAAEHRTPEYVRAAMLARRALLFADWALHAAARALAS